MPTLDDVKGTINHWCDRLLWEQKVNTFVTGVGLVGMALALLVMDYRQTVYHSNLMQILNQRHTPSVQSQTINTTREPTTNELVQLRLKSKGQIE